MKCSVTLALYLGLAQASPLSMDWSSPAVSTLLDEVDGIHAHEEDKTEVADGVGDWPGAIVQVGLGQYILGNVDNDTGHRRFMGIPFASPPVGERRWRAPFPVEDWYGTQEALKPGSACMQSDNELYTFGTDMSEDWSVLSRAQYTL